MVLLCKKSRCEMFVVDNDIHLLASAAKTVNYEASFYFVTIRKICAQNINPVILVYVAFHSRVADRLGRMLKLKLKHRLDAAESFTHPCGVIRDRSHFEFSVNGGVGTRAFAIAIARAAVTGLLG
ncbi:MAG: hypothetical protein JWM80_3308 [Cyanobacteria bacterium RYN_339]|nr:hypothetical protein [Cyanobacteria bacterium RYN_339]